MTRAYQLENIHFSYGQKLALAIPELTIQRGEVTALIGPNGCGKSTLLNLLAFLHRAQQGQISLLSEWVTKKNTCEAIKRVSFLPQKPYILAGTVADNLKLALKFHGIKDHDSGRLEAALDKLNIAHLSQQQANELSGGEQQKVALARAIITEPDVLIMDEPFSYLDHKSVQALELFIRGYVREGRKTLIFSTHNRMQGVAIADNVISLVNGELVKSPLINLFHGHCDRSVFNTGKIQIIFSGNGDSFQHVSIDPDEIIISREQIISSMDNQFKGKVTMIAEEKERIRITILAGEVFQVLVNAQEYNKLAISLGEPLWVNFKSHSVLAF